MAIDQNNLRFLLWLRANGVDLGHVLTIGRLGVFLSPEISQADARRFGNDAAKADWNQLTQERFCEPIVTAIGAKLVESLDASEYEGATVIHDLNQPLPPELSKRCDLLFDGGSLEHVFDVPQALRSYVSLVRPGGWMVLDLPCNGCSGHGFYQFSPELFYRFFQRDTGCTVRAMVCVRDEPLSEWFSVSDPSAIHQRVEINESGPLHLLILVQKLSATNPSQVDAFKPVQSDYARAWTGDGAATSVVHSGIKRTLRPGTLVRQLFRSIAPGQYWRVSARRNDRRRRRMSQLGKSSHLPRVDPFTWRLS